MFKKVYAKLGKMRKEQDFIVQPRSDGTIMVQSDRSIGVFDFKTGKGKLNTKGCYFTHLATAEPFDFPPEFVQACLEVCPSQGGETTVGGATFVHTVQVI